MSFLKNIRSASRRDARNKAIKYAVLLVNIWLLNGYVGHDFLYTAAPTIVWIFNVLLAAALSTLVFMTAPELHAHIGVNAFQVIPNVLLRGIFILGWSWVAIKLIDLVDRKRTSGKAGVAEAETFMGVFATMVLPAIVWLALGWAVIGLIAIFFPNQFIDQIGGLILGAMLLGPAIFLAVLAALFFWLVRPPNQSLESRV